MNVIVVALVALSALSIAAQAVAAPCLNENNSIKSDGECWRVLEPLHKDLIVRGMWSGIQAQDISASIAGQGHKSWSKDWLRIPQHTTTSDITAYFDELYVSPANRGVSWSNAYMLASLKMQGEDETDRMRLLAFYREHSKLPTLVSIVQVTAPDSFVGISVDDRKLIRIHLAGLTTDGVPERVQWRAQKFLENLTLSGPDCKDKHQTYLHLAYRDDIFDSQGQLNAYVEIFLGCSMTVHSLLQQIGTRLWPTESKPNFFLNVLMLDAGLLAGAIDDTLSWSEERKRIRDDLLSRIDTAKQNQYYMYGQRTIDEVELLVSPLSDRHASKN